jgi:hypothetical protein
LQLSDTAAHPQSYSLSRDVDVERKNPINRSFGKLKLWLLVAQLNGGSLNFSRADMGAGFECLT